MKDEKLQILRHSASHVLAAAVMKLYPDTKLAIGPSIENGFYYDFEFTKPLLEKDLEKIEKESFKIVKENNLFVRKNISQAEARKLFADQPYKIELIEELKGKELSVYSLGEFTDLCAGPHVEKAGDIKTFKLVNLAGAYWRGSEKNKMLTRIYGLAFETDEELKKYEEMMVEAEKRDHKKIGKELDLFSFHPEAPGCPFWHEKGMIIWNVLETLGKNLRKKYGYVEIKTPILAKNSLWITSGHWDHYREGMFTFEVDKEIYGMKPMDCPFNIKIYQTKHRSYKELPIRYTEIGRVYRKEKSGELNGLLRVQEITQDDSHLFVREEQVKEEIISLLNMVQEYYKKLNLTPEYFLSTRPEDYIGEISTWDKAESDLKDALAAEKIKYDLKEKDGAFYGPKIDVNIEDALGRSWQVATIQLDFQLPGRFKCEYTDENGNIKTPVMIHAAVFGSFERMIGILLEHFGGALPLWLSPVQVKILPISDKFINYAQAILNKLQEKHIRVELDQRSETLGAKIRGAELTKTPFVVILGAKEEESSTVSVRSREKGDQGSMQLDDFFKLLKGEENAL
ncbi:MAG: threonine--tRNA ligase [Patescibacteria group bacterium]